MDDLTIINGKEVTECERQHVNLIMIESNMMRTEREKEKKRGHTVQCKIKSLAL